MIRIGLQKRDEHKAMRDGMAKVSQGVQIVKAFVDQTIKASPETSLVWAEVCIVLPLITNPHVTSETNKDSFNYVTSRLSYYPEVEQLVWVEDQWNGPELEKLRKDAFCHG